MRHYDADDAAGTLEGWEIEDGGFTLSIWNEAGDITAAVRRPDGTRGHAFGGPVYKPWPDFANVCEHFYGEPRPWRLGFVCTHAHDLTAAEKRTADVLARHVGWT